MKRLQGKKGNTWIARASLAADEAALSMLQVALET
jgi:hypothetical protein